MNNGVRFGDKHSIDDWDLLMTSKSIGEAKPKTNYIQIEGRDSSLDLTEALGEVRFEDRDLSFEFDMFQSSSAWWELKKTISNYLNGRRLKVVLDQDPNYYYDARMQVDNFSHDKTVGHISISGVAKPYKYKKEVTVITHEVIAGNSYTFTNARKSVVPTLNLSANMTLKFNGISYSLNAGELKVLDIKFVEGINTIEVTTGSGTLTATYQEADL